MPVNVHMWDGVELYGNDPRWGFALCQSPAGEVRVARDATEVTCSKCLELLAELTTETLGPPLTHAQILNRVRTALRPLVASHRNTPDRLVQEARLIALRELRTCLPKDMEPNVKITYEPFRDALTTSVTWRPK